MARYLWQTARRLLARLRPPPPDPWHVHASYAIIPRWTPPIQGLALPPMPTLPVSTLLSNPIIRDTLTALELLTLPHATLLDFGCGDGQYQRILAETPSTSTWTYSGVDRSLAAVVNGGQTFPGARFQSVAEGQPLPFAEASVDMVLASGVLQYIEQVTDTLRELGRVTRNYVVVSRLPTWKYHDTQLVIQSLRQGRVTAHYPMRICTRCQVEQLFAHAGLVVAWRDYGSESFKVPGIQEPVVCLTYLLQKTGGRCTD